MQKDINKELEQIVETQTGPIAELLSSWRSTEGRIPVGVTSLIQIMMTMNTNSDIASRIGWMNRYGVTPPLAVYIQGDPRKQKRCCVFIEEGEPRIGIPEYWQGREYAAHRHAYGIYVRELAQTLGTPSMLMGYGAEREFASVFPSVIDRKTRIHMLSWRELATEYKSIDWVALFTAWGLSETDLPHLVFNVTSAAFLHHLQNRIVRWSMPKWQGWFALIAAQWIAGCSPHGPLRSAWFNYNRRFLQGAAADESSNELRYSIIRTLMPNTLGKLWVQRYCDPRLPAHIGKLVRTIQNAAAAALKNTSWMSVSTRNAAIRKLRAMDIQLCWPKMDKWTPREIACTLNSKSLIDNLLSLSKLGTDENQAMMKRGDCRHPFGEGWGKAVYEVNAYYYPDENRFLLPASILRSPFYDMKESLAWNYGGIGTTIGHEFCHAFDSDGRKYDEHGNKRDWWTDYDDREYKKRAHQVVRLYDSVLYRGLQVDGELTLIENIADLGGIEFALAGLKAAKGSLTKKDLQEFFHSYAVSWRSKDRMKRAAQLLSTDVHSPPKLRVNHIVHQMDEWYEAFDIGPESAEWVAPEKRIHFFA